MLTVTYVTCRASHAGWVKGNRTDEKGYPVPPGWGLGHEADNLSAEKRILTIRKPRITALEMKDLSIYSMAWKKNKISNTKWVGFI
jgi:hypothetical protein